MTQFPNIVSNTAILGSKPCVKGTRISVELIMEWLGTCSTLDMITPFEKSIAYFQNMVMVNELKLTSLGEEALN